jgi:hypothetical protein
MDGSRWWYYWMVTWVIYLGGYALYLDIDGYMIHHTALYLTCWDDSAKLVGWIWVGWVMYTHAYAHGPGSVCAQVHVLMWAGAYTYTYVRIWCLDMSLGDEIGWYLNGIDGIWPYILGLLSIFELDNGRILFIWLILYMYWSYVLSYVYIPLDVLCSYMCIRTCAHRCYVHIDEEPFHFKVILGYWS